MIKLLIMKQLNIALIIPLIILFSTANAKYRKKNITTVTIHFTDKTLSQQSIILRTISDYTFSTNKSNEYIIFPDTLGNYVWKSSTVDKVHHISIELENFGLLTSFIEPLDSIHIEYNGKGIRGKIKQNELIFSGKGSEKFIVMNIIAHSKPNNVVTKGKYNSFEKRFVQELLNEADSIYIYKKRILNSYKKQLRNDVFERFDAEIYGLSNFGLYDLLSIHFQSSQKDKDIITPYIDVLKNRKFKNFTSQALQAPNYLLYLLDRAYAFTNFNCKKSNIQPIDVYNQLVSSYKNKVREKILMYFILSGGYGTNKIQSDLIFQDVSKYVTTKAYYKMIVHLSKSLKSGASAFNFKLPDTTGKIVNLTDFKGKTVIIDCWFTGCSSCADVAKVLDSEILPIYNNNSDLIFVSVCVDKSKAMWIRSIKSKKYTNEKSINLYTNGEGMSHPFIKNYNFNTFPQILLVDKMGRIYSPALPRDSKNMIQVINAALSLKEINTKNSD